MIGCLGWGRLSNFWEGKGRRNYLFYNMENCLYKKSFIAVDISLRPSNSFIYPSNPTRTPHNIQIKYPYNARSDWLGQRVLFIREQMQRVVDYLWLSNFCLSILTNSLNFPCDSDRREGDELCCVINVVVIVVVRNYGW